MGTREMPRFVYLSHGVDESAFVAKFPHIKPVLTRELNDDVCVVVSNKRGERRVEDTDSVLCGAMFVGKDDFHLVDSSIRDLVEQLQQSGDETLISTLERFRDRVASFIY